MKEINTNFRREPIENSELPYVSFSPTKNFSFLKVCFLLIIIMSLINPFLPPIHRSYNFKWTFPTSIQDYFSQVKYGLLLGLVIFFIGLLLNLVSNIRTFFDRKLGFKKVGVFKVIKVWNWVTWKIVFFNDFHFLLLTQKETAFDDIEVGQIAEIERTATQKLMSVKL